VADAQLLCYKRNVLLILALFREGEKQRQAQDIVGVLVLSLCAYVIEKRNKKMLVRLVRRDVLDDTVLYCRDSLLKRIDRE